MNFTPFKVDSLKPKDKRYVLFEESGLGVRVGTTGRMTWVSMYRHKDDGKQRMMSHGRYPEIKLARARMLHTAAMKKVDEGADPAPELVAEREEERKAETFAMLADEYLNHRETKKKRSWHEEKRIIENELLPQWKRRKLKDINRRDVVKLLDEIVDRGAPVMANRTKSLILSMFKFAVDRGLMEDLPFNYMRKPGGDEQERARVLSDDEIKVFWGKLSDIPASPMFQTAFKVLLLTAARRGELAKAKIGDLDFLNKTWFIPAANSKNKHAHTLPMVPTVAKLMRELVRHAESQHSEYLLPSPIGSKQITERALTRALNRSQAVFGFDQPFIVHDLRRTIMTGLGRVRDRRGSPVTDVVKDHILNHLRPKMERAYDHHDYLDEMREALGLWDNHIQSLTTGGKVVPLRKVRDV